jgi:flagellar biosynthesis/type III secretory pathway protein FliH
MSLSRLLARDHLKDEEIRPYPQTDLGGDETSPSSHPADVGSAAEIAFDSVDLAGIAHWLLLCSTEEKARETLAAAYAEAEQIRQDAARQGAVKGREEAEREVLPATVAFGDAGQALIVLEEQLVSRYAPHMVRLALEIAERVIGRAVEDDCQIAASILERAKREVVDARQVRVWLHPEDHKVLLDLRPELMKVGSEAGRTIEVLASEEIGRGGCRLETDIGVVDATIPTQLAEVRRQLLDEDTPMLNGDCAPTARGGIATGS